MASGCLCPSPVTSIRRHLTWCIGQYGSIRSPWPFCKFLRGMSMFNSIYFRAFFDFVVYLTYYSFIFTLHNFLPFL